MQRTSIGQRVVRLLGSLKIAVVLLIAIGAVLAWGTIYEARFGTASVQRFVYHSLWFQALLAFLAVNLTIAAFQRYPWKRQHVPFVLAHIGIILILLGGIIGSRFGLDGQLVIPEGQAERTLETSGNVFAVRAASLGAPQIIPTQFETQAWIHEPNVTFPVVVGSRTIQLTVDRYYPDAVSDEEVADGGPAENPAVHVQLEHQGQQEEIWLLAKDPERFGIGWGDAHVLFLEAKDEAQVKQLTSPPSAATAARGTLSLKLPKVSRTIAIPVPEEMHRTVDVKGAPYRVTFKDYFPDFVIGEQGPTSQSDQPNNPAVSFILSGPEGSDAYLLFALHPDFQSVHGFKYQIPAQVSYAHTASTSLPPNCIALVRLPAASGAKAKAGGGVPSSGALLAVMTGSGNERQIFNPLEMGKVYQHPSLGYQVTVNAYYPRAVVTQHMTNRSNEVHGEAVHLVGREGQQQAEAWLTLHGKVELHLGGEPLVVEYRPDQRDLPFTVKLLAFRKIDYPGTQMAAGFESDVELSDTQRGIIVMRKISMNNPLRYRGYSLFQASYIPGPTQTTVLAVRNDPGTPLVYAGFLIVIAGVVSLFWLRKLLNRQATKHPHAARA